MRDGKLWSVSSSRQAHDAGSLADLEACKLPLEASAAPLTDDRHAGHAASFFGDITRQIHVDIAVPQAGTCKAPVAVQPQQHLHQQVEGTSAGDQRLVRLSTDSNDTSAMQDAQQLLQAGAAAAASPRQPNMGSYDHTSTQLPSAAAAAAGTIPAPDTDLAWAQPMAGSMVPADNVQPMAGSVWPQAGSYCGPAGQNGAQMLQHQGEHHAVAHIFPGPIAAKAAASPTVPPSAASSSVDNMPQHRATLPRSAGAAASDSAGSAAAAVAAAAAALQAAAQARSAGRGGTGSSPAASRAPSQFALLDKFLAKQQLSQVELLLTPTNVNTVYVPRPELLAFIAIQQWVQQHLGLLLPLLNGSFVLVHSNNLHENQTAAGGVLRDSSHIQDGGGGGSSSTMQHTNSLAAAAAMAAAIPWRLRQVSAVEVVPGGDPADATVVLVGGDRVAAGQVGPLQQGDGQMDQPAVLQDVVDYQYLCCELAALQAAGVLSSFRVHDVAHVAWRMKLATELETVIEQHKQEQAALVAAGDEELVEGAHQASLINVRGTLARLPPMDWVDGQILQYIELNPQVWPEAPGQPWQLLSAGHFNQLLQDAATAWQHYVQCKLAEQQPQPATDFVPWQPLAADEAEEPQEPEQHHSVAEALTAQQGLQTQAQHAQHEHGQLQQPQQLQQHQDANQQHEPEQQHKPQQQQQQQEQQQDQQQQQQHAVGGSPHLNQQMSATALAINLISGGGAALDTSFDDDEFLEDLFAPAQQQPADAAALPLPYSSMGTAADTGAPAADWAMWTQRGEARAPAAADNAGGDTRSPREGRDRFTDPVLGRAGMQGSWHRRDFESGRGGGRRGRSFLQRSAHFRELQDGPRYRGRPDNGRDRSRDYSKGRSRDYSRQHSGGSPDRQYIMGRRGRGGADSPTGRRGRERPGGSSPARDGSRDRPHMRRGRSRSRTRSPARSPPGRAGGLSGRSSRGRAFADATQRSPVRVRPSVDDSRRGSSPDTNRRERGAAAAAAAADVQEDGPYSMFRHRDTSLSPPPRRALAALAPPRYTGAVEQDVQIYLKHLAVLLAPVRLSRPNSMTLYELRDTCPMPPSARKFYGGIFSFLDARPELEYFEHEPGMTTRRTHSVHFVPRYHEELLAAVQHEQGRPAAAAAAAGSDGPGSYQQHPAALPAAVSSPRAAGGRRMWTPSAEPEDPGFDPAVIERFTRPWLLHFAEWLSHPKHAGHPSASLSELEERLPLPPVVLQHYGSMSRFVTARPELGWARPSRDGDGHKREVQIEPGYFADLLAAAIKAMSERIAAKRAVKQARQQQTVEQLQAVSQPPPQQQQQQEEEERECRAAADKPAVATPRCVRRWEAKQQQQRHAEKGPDSEVQEPGSQPSRAVGGAAAAAAAEPAAKPAPRDRRSTAAAPPAAVAAAAELAAKPARHRSSTAAAISAAAAVAEAAASERAEKPSRDPRRVAAASPAAVAAAAAAEPAEKPFLLDHGSTSAATPAAVPAAAAAAAAAAETAAKPPRGRSSTPAAAASGLQQQQQQQRRSGKADKASAAAAADANEGIQDGIQRDKRRSSSSQGKHGRRERSRSRSRSKDRDRPSKKRPSSSSGRETDKGREVGTDKQPSGKDKISKGGSRSSSKRKASEGPADDSRPSRAAAAKHHSSREPADSATVSEVPGRQQGSAAQGGSKQRGRGDAGAGTAAPRGRHDPGSGANSEPLGGGLGRMAGPGPDLRPAWGSSMLPPPPHGWPDDRDGYGSMLPPPPMGGGDEWWEPVPYGAPPPGMYPSRYHDDGPMRDPYDRMRPPQGPGAGGGMRGYYGDGPDPYGGRMAPPRYGSPEPFPIGGPGAGPGGAGMPRYRPSSAALQEFEENLHRKFMLMRPGAVLSVPAAAQLLPRDLAQYMRHADGMTVQRIVSENLAGWEVVRDAAGAEVVGRAAQPRPVQRQLVCHLWVPEKGGGCTYAARCDYKHVLPEVLWNT